MNREGIIRFFNRVFDIITETTVENEEYMPAEGAILMVMNHVSFADFPALTTQHRRDDWAAFIADKYTTWPILPRLVKEMDCVWIDRSKADFTALKKAFSWLKQGKAFALSPEGTRSKTNSLNHGKDGISMIVSKANVPIVAIGIIGSDKTFSELKRFRRPKITLRIGPPRIYAPYDPDNREESLNAITEEIMCQIAALLPNEMHGVYSGNPLIEKIRAEWREQYPGLILPEESEE